MLTKVDDVIFSVLVTTQLPIQINKFF